MKTKAAIPVVGSTWQMNDGTKLTVTKIGNLPKGEWLGSTRRIWVTFEDGSQITFAAAEFKNFTFIK